MKKDQQGSFQNEEEQKKRARRATVSCSICHAVYAPSRQRSDLLQAAPLALESAFMSMCHFCFRCRRPACPECWDEVHGLCGECVREAKLPFRTELPPLVGTLLPAPRRKSVRERKGPGPLISIRSGSFAEPEVLPIDMITTRPERPEPVLHGVPRERKVVDVPKKVVKSQVERKRRKPQVESGGKSKERKSVVRVVVWFLLGILLGALLLILLAFTSIEVNAFILNFLHVDIRMEIGYLLYIIGHIFS